MQFLKQCGVFGIPLVIITIVNIVLFVQSAIRLLNAKSGDDPRVTSRINAILFWGGLSAVLGFLGQYSGLYNGLSAIIQATEISPKVIAQGFAESFTSTIFGMTILVFSAVAWLALSGWHRRVLQSRGEERTTA